MSKKWAWMLCSVVLVLFAAQESAMAKMVIFSAVSGKVLQDGKPVPGATVEREFRWAWKDETGTDSATTGAAGDFAFAKIERSSLLGSLLPHEPVIRQTLTIKVNGKSYEGWLFNKHSYEDNGEVEGKKPLKLVCRLEAAPSRHAGGYYGICELE